MAALKVKFTESKKGTHKIAILKSNNDDNSCFHFAYKERKGTSLYYRCLCCEQGNKDAGAIPSRGRKVIRLVPDDRGSEGVVVSPAPFAGHSGNCRAWPRAKSFVQTISRKASRMVAAGELRPTQAVHQMHVSKTAQMKDLPPPADGPTEDEVADQWPNPPSLMQNLCCSSVQSDATSAVPSATLCTGSRRRAYVLPR